MNKQFYETEAYAPLCETQSAQMPPSYDDVMAAEKAILKKYAKICTSTKCCEHTQLNRSNGEESPADSANSINVLRSSETATTTATTTTETDDGIAKPDVVTKLVIKY